MMSSCYSKLHFMLQLATLTDILTSNFQKFLYLLLQDYVHVLLFFCLLYDLSLWTWLQTYTANFKHPPRWSVSHSYKVISASICYMSLSLFCIFRITRSILHKRFYLEIWKVCNLIFSIICSKSRTLLTQFFIVLLRLCFHKLTLSVQRLVSL